MIRDDELDAFLPPPVFTDSSQTISSSFPPRFSSTQLPVFDGETSFGKAESQNISAAVPESASCHQCKTKKDVAVLFYCTHKKESAANSYKTKIIKCRKKYCQSCMAKYFESSKLE